MGWTNGRYLNGVLECVAMIGQRAKDAASWDAATAGFKQPTVAVNPHRCGSLHAGSIPKGTMNYLGIDVYNDDSRVAVLDEDGKVVNEARVDNQHLDEVAVEYAGSKAAIEATGNYYTIYDNLEEYLDVVVADPNQTKAIGTSSGITPPTDDVERCVNRDEMPCNGRCVFYRLYPTPLIIRRVVCSPCQFRLGIRS